MKRLLALLPLAGVLLVLTGCGSKDALSLDPAAEAATRTAEAGSSRVEFSVGVDIAGRSHDVTGAGAFDYDEHRGDLTFRTVVPMLGDVDLRLRTVGEKLYLQLPGGLLGATLANGKTWLGLDAGKALESQGFGAVDPMQGQDPAQLLQFLRAASSGVRETGSAVVRGVETTRYSGALDVRKALDAGLDRLELEPLERDLARRALEQLLDGSGSKTFPFQVFVDEDGLLRRLTQTMRTTVSGQRVSTTMKVDYYDFGVDVDVEAPPASQVFDLTKQLQSG